MSWQMNILAESGGPTVGGEPSALPLPETPVKSRRTLYVLLGIVAIAVIVSVVVLVFFAQPGLGETIPYCFNYVAGERETYEMSIVMSVGTQSVSETGTVTLEILEFDGENYTINESGVFVVQGSSQQFSYTVKMDKSGRIVEFSNLPAEMQQMYSMMGSMPGLGWAINRTEARVGETVQMPLNFGNSSFSVIGTLNYRFGEVQNVTVPAGTYKTFKIDLSTSGLHGSASGVYFSGGLNGQIRLEYGTCRLVDMHMEETITAGQGSQSATVSITIQMTLTQDIEP